MDGSTLRCSWPPAPAAGRCAVDQRLDDGHAERPPPHRPAGPGLDHGEVVIDLIGLGPQPQQATVRDVIHDGILGGSFMRQGAFMFDLRAKEPWVGFARSATSTEPE